MKKCGEGDLWLLHEREGWKSEGKTDVDQIRITAIHIP